LLIKYIKSVLWKAAKCLSYIEDARCLKVNNCSTSKLLNCFDVNFLCIIRKNPRQ